MIELINLQNTMNLMKLSEVINPEETKQKGLLLIQTIRNSFKRNTISSSFQSAPKQYETELTSFNLHKKDLSLILDHIYAKRKLNVSDRNLIRRILLSFFKEGLILSGGRGLVEQLTYINLAKQQTIKVEKSNSKKFYLIISGKIKVQSFFYKKILSAGNYFGHTELLCQSQDKINLIKAHQKSILFEVSQTYFESHIKSYFLQMNSDRQAALMLLNEELLNKIHPIHKAIFIEELICTNFQAGDKIIKKNDKFTHLHFISKGKISKVSNSVIHKYNCIGLFELIHSLETYSETIYSVEESVVYSIQLSTFHTLIHRPLIDTLLQTLTLSLLQPSQLQQAANKVEETVSSFMRVRLVKLPHKLRSPKRQVKEKEPESFVTEFFFIPKLKYFSRKELTGINTEKNGQKYNKFRTLLRTPEEKKPLEVLLLGRSNQKY